MMIIYIFLLLFSISTNAMELQEELPEYSSSIPTIRCHDHMLIALGTKKIVQEIEEKAQQLQKPSSSLEALQQLGFLTMNLSLPLPNIENSTNTQKEKSAETQSSLALLPFGNKIKIAAEHKVEILDDALNNTFNTWNNGIVEQSLIFSDPLLNRICYFLQHCNYDLFAQGQYYSQHIDALPQTMANTLKAQFLQILMPSLPKKMPLLKPYKKNRKELTITSYSFPYVSDTVALARENTENYTTIELMNSNGQKKQHINEDKCKFMYLITSFFNNYILVRTIREPGHKDYEDYAHYLTTIGISVEQEYQFYSGIMGLALWDIAQNRLNHLEVGACFNSTHVTNKLATLINLSRLVISQNIEGKQHLCCYNVHTGKLLKKFPVPLEPSLHITSLSHIDQSKIALTINHGFNNKEDQIQLWDVDQERCIDSYQKSLIQFIQSTKEWQQKDFFKKRFLKFLTKNKVQVNEDASTKTVSTFKQSTYKANIFSFAFWFIIKQIVHDFSLSHRNISH